MCVCGCVCKTQVSGRKQCVCGVLVCLCASVCRGVLDCFSCCNELICEIELCLYTAAPAPWHCVSVCACVCLDGSSHGEWKIREREKADGPPWGPEDRQTDRNREKEKRASYTPVTHFTLPPSHHCCFCVSWYAKTLDGIMKHRGKDGALPLRAVRGLISRPGPLKSSSGAFIWNCPSFTSHPSCFKSLHGHDHIRNWGIILLNLRTMTWKALGSTGTIDIKSTEWPD